MDLVTFETSAGINLSNEQKINVAKQVDTILSKAHRSARSITSQDLGNLFDGEGNLARLCQSYSDENICLFTGAGVSFTQSKYYQGPGWWDLLMEIYRHIHPNIAAENLAIKFNQLIKKHGHPWQMASYLKRNSGADKFTEILCQTLYRRATKKDQQLRPIGADEDKRLPIAYLQHASTLNAVIAFCSKLRAVRASPCFVKNNKIQAVLTLNYDCFLEAGATQKYNSGRFKPRVTNDPPKRKGQMPVYHIHGYIPYGGRNPAQDLVLTEKSYQNSYQQDGNARIIIDEFLGNFSTLFTGISFNDEFLLQRIERLAKQKNSKIHFAILKQGTDGRLLNRLKSANVITISCQSYELIPSILGSIYITGLPPVSKVVIESKIDNKVKAVGYVELSRKQYWNLLLFNKK